MSGNASQRQDDRKSKEIPEAGEEENGSGPVEKAGKRFHPDHTGRRKLGNGFGNAAGQLGTKAGSKGGLPVPHDGKDQARLPASARF